MKEKYILYSLMLIAMQGRFHTVSASRAVFLRVVVVRQRVPCRDTPRQDRSVGQVWVD